MKLEVLDHGYVQLIESWGSDELFIEAARMSTGKGFLGWGDKAAPGDEKLLRYLYEHHHNTPFEMGGMIVEVQAPIFVFREWHRHRTQSYNELSARYTPLPDVSYVPTPERCLLSGGANKQAKGLEGRVLTEHDAASWLKDLRTAYEQVEAVYSRGLHIGIPKEIARLPVPVARYSRMRASANVRNWLHFLSLRMSTDAQWEIRQYANAVREILKERFPRTVALFDEAA